VTSVLSKNTSVRQSAVLAETREGQVWVGADVPSIREKAGCFPWVIQQTKVVGCCPGVQALTVRRCFVEPQLTCWQLKSPTYRVGCGNVGMAVDVNSEREGL